MNDTSLTMSPQSFSRLVLWLFLFSEMRVLLPAREVFGNWSTEDKAREGVTFIKRMKAEFSARAQRLTQDAGKPVDVTMPFVDGIESKDAKVAAEWLKYGTGKMGEAATARWSAKALNELEDTRKKLAAAEKPAAAAWDNKNRDRPKKAEPPAVEEAYIYEMEINARRLGVVLDNSPSMRAVLPLVRAEITRRFAGAHFLEVDSSSLKMPSPKWGLYGEWYYCKMLEERNPFDPKWFLPAIPQEEIHYHMIQYKRDTFAAMRSLVTLMEVDAIYWFCDFEDAIDPAAVRALSALLGKKVRLYIHSVKNTPPGALMNLVRETNGKTTQALPGAPGAAATAPAGDNPAAPAGEPSLVSKEFLLANTGKIVRITGVIGDPWVYESYGTVALSISPVGGLVSIDFPDKAFKPTTSKASLAAQYPVGRVFEATGLLQPPRSESRPGVWMVPNLKLRSLSDFKLLPEGTPAPGSPKTSKPASTKQQDVVPSRYKVIKPTAEECRANMKQSVTLTARVRFVELPIPGKGHVLVHLEGTTLRLGCSEKDYPGVFPANGVHTGDTVTASGKMTATQSGLPVLMLEAIKVVIAPGAPATPRSPEPELAPAPNNNPATPADAGAGDRPALITDAFLEANVNSGKDVRLTGTIAWVNTGEGAGKLFLTVRTAESSVLIQVPDSSFQPNTPRRTILAQYPLGRIFEATGIVTRKGDGKVVNYIREPIKLTVHTLTDFKILPAGTAPPAPPAAKPQRGLDPFRYRQIKPVAQDYKPNVNKLVSISAKVKMIVSAPNERAVTIELQGTNLLLYYIGNGVEEIVPKGVMEGTVVTAYGEILETSQEEPPMLKLDSLQAGGPR